MNGQKLCRSRTDCKIAGVCGGIAKYFGWDASLVRLGWVVLTLAGFSGLILYIIAAVVMPLESDHWES